MNETNMSSKKQILYSGIQPSGTITLGNYLGAIKNFILLEKDYDCLFGIADLHALTVRQDPAALRKRTLELTAMYIAAGLDPTKNIIYCQSHVPEHAELAWILNCFTYMGELSRMTQFKDKSSKNQENINAGLFTYPVLMAADILLYQTDVVPVGADQKQHLEITRDIAQRMNNLFPGLFVIPEPYIHKDSARIMSLSDPERKMSKSDTEDSMISLLDTPNIIRKKIRRAVTDSETEIRFDPQTKPGVSNLLGIYAALRDISPQHAESALANQGYGALKEATAEAIVEALAPVQQRYQDLISDKAYIESVLKENAGRAQSMAFRTLRKVYKKVGLYPLR